MNGVEVPLVNHLAAPMLCPHMSWPGQSGDRSKKTNEFVLKSNLLGSPLMVLFNELSSELRSQCTSTHISECNATDEKVHGTQEDELNRFHRCHLLCLIGISENTAEYLPLNFNAFFILSRSP